MCWCESSSGSQFGREFEESRFHPVTMEKMGASPITPAISNAEFEERGAYWEPAASFQAETEILKKSARRMSKEIGAPADGISAQ